MSAKDLGWAEIVAGIIMEFVPGMEALGTKLIIAGAVTEASILLAPTPPKSHRAPTEGTLLQTDAYANLVYGRRKVGGVLVYERPTGADNEILDMVVAHAITDPNHGINGFRSFYLNDQELRVRPSGTWAANTQVALGYSIMDGNGNAQECVKPGYTGANHPTWKTTRGAVTDDNTAQWKLVGKKTTDFTWDLGQVDSDGVLRPVNGHYVHGTVTDGDFAGMVEVWAYMGTQQQFSDIAQTLYDTYKNDPELPWADTAIGVGVVWTHWRFTPGTSAEKFNKAFGNSLPYKLEAVVEGETSPLDTRAGTTGYTLNPALVARDFLTRAPENGGCGVDASILDDTNATNPSANVCDQLVTMADGTQAPRFQCSGVVSMGSKRQGELHKILFSMAGFLVNRSTSVNNGAPVCIFSGSYSSPVGTIDETFLRGSSVISDDSYDRRYNLVRATFDDQNNGWQSMSAPPYPALDSATFQTWKSEDGGEELDNQIQLDFVGDSDHAQLVAAIIANKSRYPDSVKLECNYKPIAFNVHDRVWLNNTELGISGAIYRITNMKRLPTWCWDVELKQDDPSIWGSVIPSVGTMLDDTGITSSTPPLPTGVVVNPQMNGHVIQWDAPDHHRVLYTEVWASATQTGTYTLLARVNANGYFNRAGDVTTWYQLRASNGQEFSAFTTPVSASSATIGNLPDGPIYAKPLGAYLSAGRPYTYRGPYNSGTTYNQGDEVSAGGNMYLYISPTASSGNAPPNPTYWLLRGPLTADDLADGVDYYRWKASQQTALVTNAGGENQLHDPNFTSTDFWPGAPLTGSGGAGGVNYSASGVFDTLNQDGRGNTINYKVKGGQYVALLWDIITAGTGTCVGGMYVAWHQQDGTFITNYNLFGPFQTAVGTDIGGVAQAPSNAGYCRVALHWSGGSSGGLSPVIANPRILIGAQTVPLPGGQKADDVNVGGGRAVAETGADSTAAHLCSAGAICQEGFCYDGVPVDISNLGLPAGTTPVIFLGAGGVTWDQNLTGTQCQKFGYTNPSNTSFTPVLKIQQLTGSTTNESQNFSPYNTSAASASLSLSNVAYDDNYVANFSVYMAGLTTETYKAKITLSFNGNTVWSKTVSMVGQTTQPFSPTVNVPGMAAGETVEVAVVAVNSSLPSLKATTLTYKSGTAPVSHSATPSGAPPVYYVAYPPSS